MQAKQKFFYMATGAVLGVAILLIGMAVSPTTAHRGDTFDSITCKDLKLVDEYGNLVVWLYARNGGGIEIKNKISTVAAMTGTYFEAGEALSGGGISLYSYPDSGPIQAHWTPETLYLLKNGPSGSHSIWLTNDVVQGARVSVSYGTDNKDTYTRVDMHAGRHQEAGLSISNKHGNRVIVK